jgi:hypothetical protein
MKNTILHGQRPVNCILPTAFNFEVLMLGPLDHTWKIINLDQFDQMRPSLSQTAYER